MTLRADADFDSIAELFESDIYGSSKGRIRLRVLWEDVTSEIPSLAEGGLSVLDAGGGAGHFTVLLAMLGHSVVLCEPSRELLERAEAAAQQGGVADRVTVVHASIQDLGEHLSEQFDLVTCHAVLEWLADPRETLGALIKFMRPGGWLSLMFYNHHAGLLKRVLRGEFAEALKGERDGFAPRGWGTGAIPLREETVRGWLDAAGVRVRSKAGIRIFHDHVPERFIEDGFDALLELGLALRGTEPFASLAQHIHLVGERGTT